MRQGRHTHTTVPGSGERAVSGLQAARAAEVIVERAGGGQERGSGYLVRPGVVLTAAHVVRDAGEIRVRFEADREDEWIARAEVDWSDALTDVAVLTLRQSPGERATGRAGRDAARRRRIGKARYGAVREADAHLGCSAVGFPRFKTRTWPADGAPYRDSCHARGRIALLADRKARTLEFRVPLPDPDPEPPRSPWEGMSGAAVWAHRRIIGVVTSHSQAEGRGTLTVSRADRWSEHVDELGRAALRRAGLVPPLRRVVPWWRNARVVSGIGVAALVVGAGTWFAVTAPHPLRFEVLGSCTSAGRRLGNSSSGFTPGGAYTDEVLTPDGRPYSGPLYTAKGVVSAEGSVGWTWRCSGTDAPGTYRTRITDEASHRRTGWIPFTVRAAPYVCAMRREDGRWYAGISRTSMNVIGLGSSGRDVAEAQCLLQHLGFPLCARALDGTFGPDTEQAVIAFQRQAGLDSADGLVGQDTWHLLRTRSPAQHPAPAPHAQARSTAQATTRATAQATIRARSAGRSSSRSLSSDREPGSAW